MTKNDEKLLTPKVNKKATLFQPKYSIKLTEFIVDKIESGMNLADVCKKFGPESGGVVPNETNCYRWKKKYPEFKAAIDAAYQTFIFKLMDEGDSLTKEVMEITSALKNAGDNEEARFEATKLRGRLDAVKMRMKYIEFTLTRIAPKLVPDLKESQSNINVALPAITLINYAVKSKNDIDGITYEQNK